MVPLSCSHLSFVQALTLVVFKAGIAETSRLVAQSLIFHTMASLDPGSITGKKGKDPERTESGCKAEDLLTWARNASLWKELPTEFLDKIESDIEGFRPDAGDPIVEY